MYNLEHILYIVISLIIVGLLLFGASFIKNQTWKNVFLLFWAFACFFFHISNMYVTFFQNETGGGYAADNQLFPIYFCNYMMYLLVIASLWHNKESRFYKIFATFVAYGGVFGALITLFVTPPKIAEWGSFQSALSHSCLLIGSLWLFVGGYVKISVYNLIPYALGLVSCAIVGGVVELVFYLGGRPSPNAMYMFNGPVELPEFKWWMFVICMLAIIFVFTAIWEYFTRKKENRWYKSTSDINWYFTFKKDKKTNQNTKIN